MKHLSFKGAVQSLLQPTPQHISKGTMKVLAYMERVQLVPNLHGLMRPGKVFLEHNYQHTLKVNALSSLGRQGENQHIAVCSLSDSVREPQRSTCHRDGPVPPPGTCELLSSLLGCRLEFRVLNCYHLSSWTSLSDKKNKEDRQ